jgi:general secretion pathway protein D
LTALSVASFAQDDDLDAWLNELGDTGDDAALLAEDAGEAVADAAAGAADAAADPFEELGAEAGDALDDAADAFAGAADDAADAFGGFAEDAADGFAEAADDAADAFADPFADAGDALADGFADAGDAAADAFEDAGDALADDFADAGDAVADTLDDAADAFAGAADDAADAFADAGEELADGFDGEFADEEAAAPAAVADADEMSATDFAKIAKAEELRRSAAAAKGQQSVQQAYKALDAGKPAEAERLFNDALASIPNRPQSKELLDSARFGLAESKYRQARAALEAKDLEGARDLIDSALAIDSTHRDAKRLEAKVGEAEKEAAKYRPPARRDEVASKKDEINALYEEGRQWFAVRDYEEARRCFAEVIARDPYHKSAVRYLGKIETARKEMGMLAQETSRESMLADVAEAWKIPVGSRMTAPASAPVTKGIKKQSPSDALVEKMQTLVIPKLEFRQAAIADVVDFLVKASAENDPEGEGVNIILKGIDTTTSSSAPAAASSGDDWGDDGWGDEGTDDAFGASGSGSPDGITLNLRRISVFDAIKYITEVAGLKYRIEDRAVIITSLDAPTGSLLTRIYPVEPSIIESVVEREESDRDNNDFVGMASAKVTKTPIQQFFEGAGVPFPAGAKCQYRNSRLIVRNTADNLEIFERILQEFNVVPSQIEIEARFIEVDQTDLDELGLQWILNDNWEIAHQKHGNGRIQMNANSAGATQGLRFFGTSGTDGAISPMTAASVAAANSGASLLGNILSFSGVLTNPEATLVIQALSQHGGSDLLSAPRVTARSEEPAMIQVVKEIIYPTEFSVTQPSVDSDGHVTMGPIAEPGSFTTRATGVILSVTPTVGPDGYTIELVLAPECCELVDWIQYGSEIQIPVIGEGDSASDAIYQVWSYNMPAPVFTSRNVTTKISVWDGHTVVLGGLIREELVTIKDKIPILGDIPLLGRLFRSEGQSSRKKNLLIFVTARLVDPSGRPIHAEGTLPGQGVTSGDDSDGDNASDSAE